MPPEAEDKENPSTDEPHLGPEQMQVLKDLNWLIREGAVIAFGDGKIELAKAKISKANQKTESNDRSSETGKDQNSKDSK